MRTSLTGSLVLATLSVMPQEILLARDARVILVDDDDRRVLRASSYDDSRPYGRDRYEGGAGYYGRGSSSVDYTVASIQRDVQVIGSRSYVDRHEADHFRRVIESLADFRGRLRRGQFDRGRLDRAIDNIEDLARAHQVHPRDRRILREHERTLRVLRSEGYAPLHNSGYRRGSYDW